MKRGSKDASLYFCLLVNNQAIKVAVKIRIMYSDMAREKSKLIIFL